jgi:hypothetical protein
MNARTHALRDGTPFMRTSKAAENVLHVSFPDGAMFRLGVAMLRRCGTKKQRDAFIISCLAETTDWDASPGVDEFLKRKRKQGDRAFCAKLYRAMAERKRRKREGGLSRIEQFLLVNWDEGLMLKHFTAPAVVALIGLRTKQKITVHALRKIRDRLDLRPEKPVLVRHVKLGVDGVIEFHQR